MTPGVSDTVKSKRDIEMMENNQLRTLNVKKDADFAGKKAEEKKTCTIGFSV